MINISIDDVRLAIQHLKNVNLLLLMVYFLIILLKELNCYFLILLCYFVSHQPAMAVCMPTPINQLLNDESIAVQIIYFLCL